MAKNRKFKNAILQIHLWLGLATGLVVFIVSITGCLYVFEKEIRSFTEKDLLYVAKQPKPFAGISAIVENYNKISKKGKITSIRINNSRSDATVAVYSGKKKIYYFNPYTAELVKKAGPDWLQITEDLHRTLLLGETGEFIMNWSVVIFVLMLITGWVLWFPNQMRLLRQSLTIKWNASFKRVNYDLHNVLGFYASGILIIIALSGLYFAFGAVKKSAVFLTGTKLTKPVKVPADPSAQVGTTLRYDQIYDDAIARYPGPTETTISLRKTGDLRLRMIYPGDLARNQNVFLFNPETGQMTSYKLYKDFKLADKVESSNYDLHTGQMFGMFGKIVAFCASLISASLPVTGVIIWLKKKKKTKKKPALVKPKEELVMA